MSKSSPNRSAADKHAALTAGARAHVARWIDHPEVRMRVAELAEWSVALLEPIQYLIPAAPRALAVFIAEGLAIRVPSEHLSPPVALNRRFTPIDAQGEDRGLIQEWTLSEPQLAAVKRQADDLGETVSRLARALENDGVKIDVTSPGDLLVLGQLVLSQPFERPEFADKSGKDLARYLYVFAAGTIGNDAQSVYLSDHTTAAEERDLATLRAKLRATREGVKMYRASYAGDSGKRRSPGAVIARRNALREVLQQHPDVDAMTLYRGWRSSLRTNPGRMLRDLMGMGPNELAPSPDVLRKDLKLLREAAAESD